MNLADHNAHSINAGCEF